MTGGMTDCFAPTADSADTGVLQPEEVCPTILNGVPVPGGEWSFDGRGCCRVCGGEFAFTSEEVVE